MNDSVEFNPTFPSRSDFYLLVFYMHMSSCVQDSSRNWTVFLFSCKKNHFATLVSNFWHEWWKGYVDRFEYGLGMC